MDMSVKMLRLSTLCLPLLALAACGEGWEAQKTNTHFPYGNQRTAGYGVVYVRVKMLPEKELKVEPIVEAEVAEPTPEPEVTPIKPADEIFNEAQTKGGKPLKREKPVKVDVEVEKETSTQNYKGAALAPMSDEGAADASAQTSLHDEGNATEASAEDYISQAPKQIEIPEVKIVDENDVVGVPAKDTADYEGDTSGDAQNVSHNQKLMEQLRAQEAVVENYNESVEGEAKEVISPKRSYVDDSGQGHNSLSEIYSDPF
jgi:hypothetical protein